MANIQPHFHITRTLITHSNVNTNNLTWQKKLGHCLGSSTEPRIFHFVVCDKMLIFRPEAMQMQSDEYIALGILKMIELFSHPLHSHQKSVLQKQKSIIQEEMKIAQIYLPCPVKTTLF